MKKTKSALVKSIKQKLKGGAMKTPCKGGEMKIPCKGKAMKKTRILKDVEVLAPVQRFQSSMVDRVLPASRPLIQLGSAQFGDVLIRG